MSDMQHWTAAQWRRVLTGKVVRVQVNGRIATGWVADVFDGPPTDDRPIAVFVAGGSTHWLEPYRVWRRLRK